MLHTFSKAYGLAGLRVGYAVAPADVAENLRKAAVPFAVSQLAQIAAIESLRSESELQPRISSLVLERARITERLREIGWPVVESQANFIWLVFGERTGRIAAAFAERNISVRAFDGEGIRVSIGTPEANRAVLTTAADIERSEPAVVRS